MRIARAVFALIVVPVVLSGQKLTDAEKKILTLQDQRSLGNGELVSYLANPDAQLRYCALIALANIQDTSTTGTAAALLHDPQPSVRAAAAFALGQIGTSKAEDSLLSALRRESDSTVVARILEALGKVGGENALEEIVAYGDSTAGPSVRSEQALAVARFALRTIRSERSIWFCFDLITHPSAQVRWMALLALWRTAPHGLIDIEIAKRVEDLKRLANDPNMDVRLHLASLLARSKSGDAGDLVRAIQDADRQSPNWQVEVQLAQAFASLSSSQPEFIDDLIACLSASNGHVKIAALQSLSALPKQSVDATADTLRLREQLGKLVSTKNPDAELTRGEAFVTLAKLFPEEFGRKNFLANKELSVRERAKVLEALSYVPTGRSLSIMLFALDDPNVRVAMAAWDFVRRFLTPFILSKIRSGDPDWVDARPALYRKTLYALKRKDMAITHLVSNALVDTTYFGMFKESGLSDSLVLALKGAFSTLTSPDDVEAMQAAIAAMGRIGDKRFVSSLESALKDADKTVAAAAALALHDITGKDYSSQVPKSTKALHTDYDWSALESIAPLNKAFIQTSKGMITLELLKEDAPFTVLSFVRLAKKKFYNGLQFHRVVPNFVIQGGDPRGDGWGGPGYAIRSEFSLARFGRGMVGIASAGKDTEGCQFFITHLPTPHLDGRYTIFARVVAGQDVVDRIQIGDTITQITLE